MNTERQKETDIETLDRDEAAVRDLVAGLRRLDAPANFESRVMARIAEGPTELRAYFAFPALAYGLPLILVLLFASFLVFRTYRQSTPAQSEPVAAADREPLKGLEPQPVAAPSREFEQPLVAENERVRSDDSRSVSEPGAKRPPVNATTDRGGGSYIETLPQKKPPMPRGLPVGNSPSPSDANRVEVITTTSISVREILSAIGITAEFDGGWKVTRVGPNTPAERVGIRVGDVVIGLDDRQISADTEYQGSGSVSTIHVQREGKTVAIKLK